MLRRALNLERLERRELLAANPFCGSAAKPVQVHVCAHIQECAQECPGLAHQQQQNRLCDAQQAQAQEQTQLQERTQQQMREEAQSQQQTRDESERRMRLRERLQTTLSLAVQKQLQTQWRGQSQNQVQDGECDGSEYRLRGRDRYGAAIHGGQVQEQDRDERCTDTAIESLAATADVDGPLRLRGGYGANNETSPTGNENADHDRDRLSW